MLARGRDQRGSHTAEGTQTKTKCQEGREREVPVSAESLIHSTGSKVLRSSNSHFSLFVEEESKSKRGPFIEGFTESLDGA